MIEEIRMRVESLKETSRILRPTDPEIADEVDEIVQLGEIYLVRLVSGLWPDHKSEEVK